MYGGGVEEKEEEKRVGEQTECDSGKEQTFWNLWNEHMNKKKKHEIVI